MQDLLLYGKQINRQAQTVAGTATTHPLDIASGLPHLLIEATSGQTNTYLTGLAQRQGAAMVYNLPDALGSVRQVVQVSGQVTLAQTYDPFACPELVEGGAV